MGLRYFLDGPAVCIAPELREAYYERMVERLENELARLKGHSGGPVVQFVAPEEEGSRCALFGEWDLQDADTMRECERFLFEFFPVLNAIERTWQYPETMGVLCAA